MASIKHLVDIDLNKNQITNVKLQHLSGNPSGTGEDYEGRIFYDSDNNAVKFHNGTSFVALGTSNATGDITGVTAGDGLSGGGSSGDVTIAITSDTMYLGGDGSTGSRTLAAYGVATAIKVASTTWVISGTGVS